MAQPGVERHRHCHPQRPRFADLPQRVDPAEIDRRGAREIRVGRRLEGDVDIAAILFGAVADLAWPVEHNAAVVRVFAAAHPNGGPVSLDGRGRHRLRRYGGDRRLGHDLQRLLSGGIGTRGEVEIGQRRHRRGRRHLLHRFGRRRVRHRLVDGGAAKFEHHRGADPAVDQIHTGLENHQDGRSAAEHPTFLQVSPDPAECLRGALAHLLFENHQDAVPVLTHAIARRLVPFEFQLAVTAHVASPHLRGGMASQEYKDRNEGGRGDGVRRSQQPETLAMTGGDGRHRLGLAYSGSSGRSRRRASSVVTRRARSGFIPARMAADLVPRMRSRTLISTSRSRPLKIVAASAGRMDS